ncbi:hypothetical protein ACKWTF_004849 [Chironomus riparius]
MSGISDKNLSVEIELLKRALAKKEEENLMIFDRKIELEESLVAWKEKFQRLYESHKKVQSVNQNLEEKLLKLVDKNASDRAKSTRNSANTNIRMNQANFTILHLQREIERYKRDIALAIHLLRCNPKGFMSPSIKSFPADLQTKISKYVKVNPPLDTEESSSTVFKGKYQSIPTNEYMSSNDFESPDKEFNVSPIAISKFLEDEISEVKHCETCCCASVSRKNIGMSQKSSKYDYVQFDRKLSSPSSFNSQVIDPHKQKNAILNNQNFVHHKMCERVAGNCQNNTNNNDMSAQKKNVPNESRREVVVKKQSIENAAKDNKSDNKVPKKSNARAENGTKTFEDYNKNLLEYIKNKNIKKNGPRICALRIQDDGICIDSTHNEIFMRKKSLIDFDAFDKYESISPLIISSIASTIDEHVDDEIFSVNKTDSEKFNEIKSLSNAHGYSTSEPNFEQNQSPNENAVMKHQRITEWINSSINAPIQSDNMNALESSSDFNDNHKSNDSNMSSHSETSPELYTKEGMNIHQMEYNVKQFLLKQNEWSVYRDLSFNEMCDLKILPIRTETNL